MRKRSRLSRKTSNRVFRKTADLTHGRNVWSRPMRGGIRL